MHDTATIAQISELKIDRARPLIVCDVDEVVVHFLRGLEAYLARQDLWLDPASFALNGNIRCSRTKKPISPQELGDTLMAFFAECTRDLEAIDGAARSLADLGEEATVVMLTNLPGTFREDRIANLHDHGLQYPVITNQGPKGAAVRALAQDVEGPVYFIDDNPGYLQSVCEHVPDAILIHFMQDHRFGRHVLPLDCVSLRSEGWTDTHAYIHSTLAGTPDQS